MRVWMLLAVACRSTTTDDGTAPTDDPTVPEPTDAAGHSGHSWGAWIPHSGHSASEPTGHTGTTDPVDCSVLPTPSSVTVNQMSGWGIAEDFDFDLDGNHVAIRNGALTLKNQAGQTRVAAAGFNGGTAGTRVLATGDMVVCDFAVAGLTLVDKTTGGRSTILSGLAYPNGLEVDRQNRAYVADNSSGTIHMVDVYTQDHWIVATGLASPNGVILSPDQQVLYVGSFGGNVIYAIPRLSETSWAQPRVLVRDPRNGGFDGINVDVCGNVYYTEFIAGNVWRVTPDGTRIDRMVRLPSAWIPNLRWGSGVGGWDPNKLYVADRQGAGLFELDLGLPGPRHVGLP
ncbi:MAG: SMP-30/gluconolactonase/LRE family protein [Alphaproteobacteria bacterium]|nr:SMP-30/gluconolactonase/LRE family protein [Alphaproteobacteria bacterium]